MRSKTYHHLAELVNMIRPDRKNITGAQLRAARALLGWSAEDLAKAARIGVTTVRRAEANDGEVSMMPNNLDAVVRALASSGVIFINDNGEGVTIDRRRNIE